MSVDKREQRVLEATAEASAALRRLKEETGLDYQVYLDSEGNSYSNYYDDKAYRMGSPQEGALLLNEFVEKVESKGSINKPEAISFTVKFKDFLTKFRG